VLDEPTQCRTVVSGVDAEILPGEIVGEQLPLRRLVIDHNDMRPWIHGLPIGNPAIIHRLD